MIRVSDRRRVLLHSVLAGMDVLWFTPLFILFWPKPGANPLSYFMMFWAGTLLWALCIAFVRRPEQATTAPYVWGVPLLLFVSTLALIRWRVYGTVPWSDARWIPDMLHNLVRLRDGLQAETVLLLTNLFLWLRATWAINRNLTWLHIATLFKWEFLLLMLSLGWLEMSGKQPAPLILIWVYVMLALLALSLAHTMERAACVQTRGRLWPWGRWMQFLSVIGFGGGVAFLLMTYAPGPVNQVLAWVPFVMEMFFVTFQLFIVLLVVLTAQLAGWLMGLFHIELTPSAGEMVSQQRILEDLRQRFEAIPPQDVVLPGWMITLLRFLPLIVLLVGGVGLFLWAVRRFRYRSYYEAEAEEMLVARGNWLRRGISQLQDLAGMVQRFGISRQLLAAISVQNIYANLTRIAARAGHPRPASMPPDAYLPILVEVFGGYGDVLARITHAYMRVHYGDESITARELARLQVDYRQVRRARGES